MRSERARTRQEDRGIAAGRKLAGAPISWGVCEVPGWGRQLPPDRVLAEMASLGLRATELGPVGYLGMEPAALKARLDHHGLALVGGFVPLVLHEPDAEAALHAADEIATTLAQAGADVFVAALVMDADWAAPAPLSDAQLATLAEHLHLAAGVVAARGLDVRPASPRGHARRDRRRRGAAARREHVGWCLDTGHLLIGGCDPLAFVREHGQRVVHVHLKDVDAAIAARYRAGELTLMGATQAGLFRPLGRGDARIGEVLAQLDAHGYERWLVLEQDAALTGEEPPVGSGPVLDVQASIEFLTTTAPRRERVA